MKENARLHQLAEVEQAQAEAKKNEHQLRLITALEAYKTNQADITISEKTSIRKFATATVWASIFSSHSEYSVCIIR